MNIRCPCGVEVKVPPNLLKRKRYCSKKCFYLYRKTGGWNKGLKGTQGPNSGSFQKGFTPWNKGMDMRERSPVWKGDKVSKDGLHSWVEKRLGKPMKCEFCKTTKSKVFQWSNKSEKYLRDLSDWQRLCIKCHVKYDYEKFGKRKAFFKR